MKLPRSSKRTAMIITGAARGAGAAMMMSALRQVTTGLGLVEQTPPDAILKQRAFGPLVRMPRLAFVLARRQVAIVELAHWAYGAAGGAAFALLPRSVLDKKWTGVGYGLATWALFELSIAPLLGLEQATKIRPVERLMFAGDHLLYGVILAGDEQWIQPNRRSLTGRR